MRPASQRGMTAVEISTEAARNEGAQTMRFVKRASVPSSVVMAASDPTKAMPGPCGTEMARAQSATRTTPGDCMPPVSTVMSMAGIMPVMPMRRAVSESNGGSRIASIAATKMASAVMISMGQTPWSLSDPGTAPWRRGTRPMRAVMR